MKWIQLCLFLAGMPACHPEKSKPLFTQRRDEDQRFRIFSGEVNDSFDVFVHLPEGYDTATSRHFPVVYLLDANLYFDVMSAVLRRYTEVGLSPEVILIGVGYKDFPTMDSLRNRDDTYPTALAEYEMRTSGGAERMVAFLRKKLISEIDHRCRTDSLHRILMGHSLGGYFTTYSLLRQLEDAQPVFTGFVAASPSLAYNKYYLLKRFFQAKPKPRQPVKWKVYLAYGGSEYRDPPAKGEMSWSALSKSLHRALDQDQSAAIDFRLNRFSGLEHMETQLPAFIQGLQWILADSTAR